MYGWSRHLAACVILAACTGVQAAAMQDPGEHQHDMPGMAHEGPSATSREGSGTSWLPENSPVYGIHAQAGGWMLMGHGNVFAQYLHDTGDRGHHQFGSINWAMGMASRPAGPGTVQLRAMMSLEPATIGGCGYPDLLASGEVCDGDAIYDQQHPHDLFMELAAAYDAPLAGGVRFQAYGGLAGEPALGPVAFPHRLSAMPNPLAPISHHWFDATHVTYGVVTGGLFGPHWKAEVSAFNGREPDEHRTNLDLDALDSWSTRLTFLPDSRWAVQMSAGHLEEAEPGHDEHDARVDVDRLTISATHHRVSPTSVWASTAGFGRNIESSVGTGAFLAETSLTLQDRDAWFGRFEVVRKEAHDLGVESEDLFTLAKLQAGYTRYLDAWRGLKPGAGASLSLGFVPSDLGDLYGGRVNYGFAIFLTLRPARAQ